MPKKLMALQAIVTSYHGATAKRGARVIARAAAGTMTMEWNHSLDLEDNHAAVARGLAERFGWSGVYHMGGLHDGRFAFVCIAGNDRQSTRAFHVGGAS